MEVWLRQITGVSNDGASLLQVERIAGTVDGVLYSLTVEHSSGKEDLHWVRRGKAGNSDLGRKNKIGRETFEILAQIGPAILIRQFNRRLSHQTPYPRLHGILKPSMQSA